MHVEKKVHQRKTGKKEAVQGSVSCGATAALKEGTTVMKDDWTARKNQLKARYGIPAAFSGIAIHREIKKGVGIRVLDRLKHRLSLSDKQMAGYLGTSSASLQRKRAKRKNVSFVEGDRLYRMERILAKAAALLRDEAAAADWLKSPKLALGGCTPLELMESEAGAREVEDLLGRIEHGVIS